MRRPLLTTARQRIAAAHVTGLMEWASTKAGPTPIDEAVTWVHAITEDPQVIGDVLGCYLARADIYPAFGEAVDVLREAGADEVLAAEVAAWQRWQRQRAALGGFQL